MCFCSKRELLYRLGDSGISLNMDLEGNLFFGMDTAVPLGMIINELVTNSLKHAFKGRARGEIRIKFHKERKTEENKIEECEGSSFTLTVSDNGIGIPENLDFENLDTLGFQLVASLVGQLDGEFKLRRDNGIEFTMRFIVTEKK
jgi:two-component sensor histidine kinase